MIVLLCGEKQYTEAILSLCEYTSKSGEIVSGVYNDMIIMSVTPSSYAHLEEVYIAKCICSSILLVVSSSYYCKHIWGHLKPDNCAIVVSNSDIVASLSKSNITARENYGNYDIYDENWLQDEKLREILSLISMYNKNTVYPVNAVYKHRPFFLLANENTRNIQRKDTISFGEGNTKLVIEVSLLFNHMLEVVEQSSDKLLYLSGNISYQTDDYHTTEHFTVYSSSLLRANCFASLLREENISAHGELYKKLITRDQRTSPLYLGIEIEHKILLDENTMMQQVKEYISNKEMLKHITFIKQHSTANAIVSHTFNIGGKHICGGTLLGEIRKDNLLCVIRDGVIVCEDKMASLQAVGKEMDKIFNRQTFALSLVGNFEFKKGDKLLFWRKE